MDILLVIIYALVLSILIWRSKFFECESLSKQLLLSVFLIKCMLGISYTYIHIHKYGGGDTLAYFNDANIIYNILYVKPAYYLQLVFGINGRAEPEHLRTYVDMMGYWWDTSAYTVVRFNAIAHLLSFGNFYVHVIFMSFLSFLGMYFIYLSLQTSTAAMKGWVWAGIFFIPSALFWTSGVHKEGILIFGLGLFFYSICSGIKKRQLIYLLPLVLSGGLIYLTRDFILLLLIPGLIAFLVSLKIPRFSFLVFPVIYLIIAIGGSWIQIFNGMNYLDMITYKQELFRSLEAGNTQIHLSAFHPDLASLLTEMPRALMNSLLGPFLIENNSLLQWLTFLENIALCLLILLTLIFTTYNKYQTHPILVWYLFFALSLIILIGYIVPNVGAIVRYRSICWPFLFSFLLYNIDPGKFKKAN